MKPCACSANQVKPYTSPGASPATRLITAPPLTAFFAKKLRGLSPGQTVYEVGAGYGALREMAGNHLPDGIRWIETDCSRDYLEMERQYPTEKKEVALPNVAASDGEVNLILGLDVADMLTYAEIEDSFHNFYRALSRGGRVLLVGSFNQSLTAEDNVAQRTGLKVFPYYHSDNPLGCDARLGLYHIDPQAIRKIAAEWIRSSFAMTWFNGRQVFEFLAAPINYVRNAENEWRLGNDAIRSKLYEDILKVIFPRLFKDTGAIKVDINNHPEHLLTRWSEIARNVGFRVITAAGVTETVIIEKPTHCSPAKIRYYYGHSVSDNTAQNEAPHKTEIIMTFPVLELVKD